MVDKRKSPDLAAGSNNFGYQGLAKIVGRVIVPGIANRMLKEKIAVKHIVAHGSQTKARLAGQRGGVGGLFRKACDPQVAVHGHHPITVSRLLDRHFNAGNGEISLPVSMGRHHGPIIHLVDMVPSKDQQILRILLANHIDILVHRINSPCVPIL